MKVAALFSGGKDSVYSIYVALQWGWEVTWLVTLEPLVSDSWMFHSINISFTDYQSQALHIPLCRKKTSGGKETELNDLYEVLKQLDVDGVLSGAIASEYQRTKIERICHELNLKSFTPLWHKNQEMLLRDMIKAGFSIVLVGVFAEGFDQSLLGQLLNEKIIADLVKLHDKYHINLAGEGGEYETFVVDGPIFSQKIIIDQACIDWKRDHGVYQIQKVHLEPKKEPSKRQVL